MMRMAEPGMMRMAVPGMMRMAVPWRLALLVLVLWPGTVCAQELPTNGVNGYSLHPPYFNLAEGTKISATATCGEGEAGRAMEELYCKLVGGPVSGDPSQTIQGQYCDVCMASNREKAHPITNAIDGTERWWQSPPLSRGLELNEVNVTLDLGQVFHVAYVWIKFANSPRPDLWVLERSTDYGATYQPWQYFASSKRDCLELFGLRSMDRITKDDDVICTTEYSRIVPLENGEIVVSLVIGRPGAMNFTHSPVLRNFTKATHIRLRFLRTNTLLGHLMGKTLRDPTVTRRYYYSLKDISIGGRCVCNGHAEVCNAKDPVNPYRLHCVCQHNTCGGSCDRCCPGYHQLPWKPATMDSANECEPCNCNGHAHDCYYDPDVDLRRASMNRQGEYAGGGVCIDCKHNTDGVNCERCRLTYYKSPDHPIDSPYICQKCACDSEYMDGTCEDLTGRCYCKPNYTGKDCGQCAEGFANFPECYAITGPPGDKTGEQILPVGEIINCDCHVAGTVGNACRKDPVLGACVCKPNFQGDACDDCAPHFFGPNCQECLCSGPGVYDGSCDKNTGHCVCRDGFVGFYCEQCSSGFFNYPLCQLCPCSSVGTQPNGCDDYGRCLCKPEYGGPRCDKCELGYHSYPHCHACSCDPRGSEDNICTQTGHCQCRPNYSGQMCNQCAPGFYGFPDCAACQCSPEGSLHSMCDPQSGQCRCRHGVGGLRCDVCVPGMYGFPNCEVGPCNPSGSSSVSVNPPEGSCECREHVEGTACDKCKPLYWNLLPENPQGCTKCHCGFEGTLSGVGECQQASGQCFCKPNICSRSCSSCKDGFYNLEPNSYFGCQGCQCDIGGSIGLACHEESGECQCRENVEGSQCNRPSQGFYFPDLHHLKYEVEDGVSADGRPVRFGYNPLEFENFSWRGYAQMSPVQPKVVLTINVTSPDLFRVVFRYVNRGPDSVSGTVTFREDSRSNACANCSEQSKQITFPPSTDPAFVTIPQGSFGSPFVLNPNTWSVKIEVEDVLLDYLVLLPSAYYEAPILQVKVTEPCSYLPSADQTTNNCLLYKYLSLDGFTSAQGSDGICRLDNNLPRPCQAERITPRHPPMVMCYGNDVDVQFRLLVPHPGRYVVLVEYANEEEVQPTSVTLHSPPHHPQQGTIKFYPCKFSFLCRGVVLDAQHRVASFDISTEAIIRFTADQTRFHLAKIYLIPSEQFTMEYIQPRVHCIAVHGSFSPSSGSCVPSRFQKPSQSVVLREGKVGSVPDNIPLSHGFLTPHTDGHQVPTHPDPLPPTAIDATKLIHLHSPQTVVGYNGRVQSPGRYAFVVHYYQPSQPTFTIEVLVHGGRVWQGSANATYCPHGYGCRSLVVSENHVVLDVTDNDLTVTVRVPGGKIIWLEYILVIPEDSYSSSYLVEEPLDKSYNFISQCGANSFQSNPAPFKFCRDAAVSLSLFYNNGAQPCNCHEAGAVGASCEPYGGQCTCRPHVIGRDCSHCAVGYWAFPNCRPCECGSRLCDEVTGQCICPPRTVKPECTVCQPQTFGCHALIGCENCDCSRTGLQNMTELGCDIHTGQCTCKPNIMGRRCDKCAPGYFGYPNCRPCECNRAGTEPSICDPVSGQCHCKENVEGLSCERCRLGTFYLDGDNPKGCTRCFCFGATDRCHTGSKYRAEFSDMTGWVLVGGDRQEVETSVQPNEGLVTADLSDIPDVYQEFYWLAPRSYLGDRVSSYGGSLRYELHSEALRGDPLYIPVERRADVILKGNQMSIAYLETRYPAPGESHQRQIYLLEGNFIHTQTHNPVSREDLMMVLTNLEQLQIRALNSQSSSSVSLRRVILEIGQETRGDNQARNVELCLCPANYRGDSCQECAPGFYRDTKGLFLGKCVPCNCSGHSDQCLAGSGACVTCQHNTEGKYCERCKDGFVANRTLDGSLQCVSCPCPLSVPSNNFAIGCVQRGPSTQCLCKPGYAGANCERCAPGYYGNPMVIGSFCRPCNCNGNTDSNMLFSDCDPLSGMCSGCMFNTAGPHCEICAPGFYGDAVSAKNCTRCDCSVCGTESCDQRTGRCLCKAGVTGSRCDRCKDGFSGFNGCSGCQQCSCGSGSAGTGCDPHSGQCRCLPGVTGPRCQQCTPGYWNFGPTGCTKCSCKGGSCDPRTGECQCSDDLMGKQCDTCSRPYEIPVTYGTETLKCEPCDSCVVTLLEDLQRMADFLPSIRDQLTNLTASSIAWTRLSGINSSIANLTEIWLQYQGSVNGIKDKADDLEDDSISLAQDLDALQEKMNQTKKTAFGIQKTTKATSQRAKELSSRVQSLYNTSLGLIDQLRRIGQSNSTNVTSTDEFRQITTDIDRMLKAMRIRDFKPPADLATQELEEAKKLLDRVKAEMVTGFQNLLSETRRRLDSYNSEVMDLRDAMNEAVNKTRQAEDLNSLNQNNVEENNIKVNDLRSQHEEMVAALKMAEDALVQVSDLLQTIESLKEEYEKLAAGLDGARGPLMDKVKKFSPASGKIPIVEKAEMHAKQLWQLSKNLFSAIGDSDQEVYIQKAINASNAYSNIIESVREAEKAAKDANRAAGDAVKSVVSEDLGKKGKDLLKKSVQLEESAKSAESELKGDIERKLQEARRNLQDRRRKKESLQSELKSVLDKLRMTPDNVTEDLTSAKLKAAEANSTAARVEATLTDIKKDLEQWKNKYGNLQNEDVNKAVEEAKTSVSNLENTIPLLLDKLNNLENRQGQNGSVSDSIQRIRQLISQARDAASKVKVPVKFNGNSGVQLRPPSNMADLSAYTSLKLHIQNAEPQSKKKRQVNTDQGRFVLYLGHEDGLGDYLGMVLKGNRLNFVYKLAEEQPTYLTTSEDITEQFVTVTIERMLQYGQMSTVVFSSQSLHEKKGESTASGDQGLLNLDPSRVVFYVGGYPDGFVPPDSLNYPKYRGCIEMDSLNEKPISLYDFERTFYLDTLQDKPCGRSKSTNDPWLTDGSYFDGTGYAEIKLDQLPGSTKRFEMDVRLVSYNGILFFLDAEDQFLCLAVEEGKLILYYDVGEGLQKPESVDPSNAPISTSTPKSVHVILVMTGNKKRIFVRLERINVFIVEYESGKLETAQYFYLGGLLPSKFPESLKDIFPGGGSIRGCMKGLKALGKYMDLKRMNTTGVSYGCTSDLLIARSVQFFGHGFLSMSLKNVPTLQDDFSVGFGFQTSQINGLMYSHATEGGSCQISLQDGLVNVKMLSAELASKAAYADGVGHYLTLYSNKDEVRFYMDDQLQETRRLSSASSTAQQEAASSTVLLGGSPEMSQQANLSGCMRNIFVKRKSGPQTVLDLLQNQQSVNVTMSCQDQFEDRPLEIRALLKKDKLKARQRKLAMPDQRHSDLSCVQPKSVMGALRFGGSPFSHLEFRDLPAFVQERFHFSLEVRLNASHGVIFHASSKQDRSSVTLGVSNGRFVLQVDIGGKKLHVTSKDKYHDGMWHTVFFGREKNKLRLVVGGLKSKSRTLPPRTALTLTLPVYIGGVPVHKVRHNAEASLKSFSGCLRNLKMDGQPLNSPDNVVGVTPCYEGATEKGLFLSDGGFVTLENLVNLGQDLEVKLEIRPMRPSGLIFHIQTLDGHYLTLAMSHGKVTVAVNVGAGEYSTSVGVEQSLCDGHWHTIAVTKGSNVIQLDVDTDGNHTVGASSFHQNKNKATLYVGAMPDNLRLAQSVASSREHYHGCVRNIVINRTAIDASDSGIFIGSAGTNVCPVL
ncbi:laminin subunit alpha-5 isoform X1 [Pelobates cultripes]|nr:laminin subunit alpha-5 isoform X1 [Pelobates cultripes]